MTSMTPAAAAARSTLYPKLADVELEPCGDSYIACRFSTDDPELVARCGLMDLTPLARSGFRGAGAEAYLSARAYPVPEKPNLAAATDTGELVLRLSQREFWVLGSLKDMGQKVAELDCGPVADDNCYPLFCQDSHSWFALTGEAGAEVMAKLCAVDMRPAAFPEGAIAQTSVARINAVVVRHSLNGIPAFSLLFDSGYTPYMWEVMLDAMKEFEGAPVGISALS